MSQGLLLPTLWFGWYLIGMTRYKIRVLGRAKHEIRGHSNYNEIWSPTSIVIILDKHVRKSETKWALEVHVLKKRYAYPCASKVLKTALSCRWGQPPMVKA